MGEAAARSGLTPEQYLAFERASEERHEYADGEIFAMSGGTRAHALAAANIVRELSTALLDEPCETYGSDMRITIPKANRYVYPDASVACGRPVFEDEAPSDTLVNPVAIVEVLSDSSEAYDRGDKFAQYQLIPSLKEYVLVSQKDVRIEHFHRLADGTWLLRNLGRGDKLLLPSIGCEVAVDRVYLKVFDAPGSGPTGLTA